MMNESGGHGGSQQTRELELSRLGEGMPGITPECGGALAQAAAVCLENQQHAPGVSMSVDGDYRQVFEVEWKPATEQARRSWSDLQDATEDGACGIAAILVEELAGYTVFKRSWKGTGFDYWLSPKGLERLLFQEQARLEVSGILNGSEADVSRRLREKKAQIEKFEIRLPGFVVIVEFGSPRCRIVNV